MYTFLLHRVDRRLAGDVIVDLRRRVEADRSLRTMRTSTGLRLVRPRDWEFTVKADACDDFIHCVADAYVTVGDERVLREHAREACLQAERPKLPVKNLGSVAAEVLHINRSYAEEPDLDGSGELGRVIDQPRQRAVTETVARYGLTMREFECELVARCSWKFVYRSGATQ